MDNKDKHSISSIKIDLYLFCCLEEWSQILGQCCQILKPKVVKNKFGAKLGQIKRFSVAKT